VRVIDFTDGDVGYEFEHVPVNMPPVSAQLIVWGLSPELTVPVPAPINATVSGQLPVPNVAETFVI